MFVQNISLITRGIHFVSNTITVEPQEMADIPVSTLPNGFKEVDRKTYDAYLRSKNKTTITEEVKRPHAAEMPAPKGVSSSKGMFTEEAPKK